MFTLQYVSSLGSLLVDFSILFCTFVLNVCFPFFFIFKFFLVNSLLPLFQDPNSCRCDQNANNSKTNRNHLSPCQPKSGHNPHLQLFPDSQWEGGRYSETDFMCFVSFMNP